MNNGHLKSIFVFVAASLVGVVLLWVLYETRYMVLAALIGIGLGAIISPIPTMMNKRVGIPRSLATFLVFLGILSLIGGTGYAVYSLGSQQVVSFMERAPEIFNAAKNEILGFFSAYPWIAERFEALNLGSHAQAIARVLFTGILTTFAAMAGVVIILTIGLYVTLNAHEYFRGFLSLFPAYLRPKTGKVVEGAGSALRLWFRGQLLVMAISGAVTMLTLWILGIEFWFVLGLITFILGFIPFIGAFISGTLTALVTLGSQPELIWWVLGLYIMIQQLEDNVTIPLVMRGSAKLPEVHLVILMLIMGHLFGIIGVFLAPPLLAVGHFVYMATYVPRMNSIKTPPGNRPRPDRISGRPGRPILET